MFSIRHFSKFVSMFIFLRFGAFARKMQLHVFPYFCHTLRADAPTTNSYL